MIEHLKAKKHRGITEVKLLNLGRINIICGKNNSGKTSFLEAITKKDNFAIGKNVDNLNLLEDFFSPDANTYSTPNPKTSKAWFSSYVSALIESNTIWFSDEEEKIVKEFRANMQRSNYLKSHQRSFSFNKIVKKYFEENYTRYKPILIPPKRHLETTVVIQSEQAIKPTGEGLINKLFFLKNQSSVSEDSKKYEKINISFNEITGCKFDINTITNNNIILIFKKDEGSWINASECGLGLLDILTLVIFAIDSEYTLILVEEPESHLHPDIQRKLLHFFSKITDKQFILSTHSNIFLDSSIVDKIYFSSFNDSLEITDETSKSSILNNLGYSVTDNLVSDLVILVEGPKDTPIIEQYLIKMGLKERYTIKIWPLGGDIMDQHDLSVFDDKSIIGVIDNDRNSECIRQRFIENCKKYDIPVTRLKRYAIENYFSLRVLKKVFPSQISDDISHIDPDKKLEKQIRINVKNNNKKLAQAMTIDEIKDTDLYSFFQKAEKICKSGKT